MAAEWIKFTKAPGIYYREHETRPAKPGGKSKDRYWRLFYKIGKKLTPEVLGWESEGWAENAVMELSAKLAGNRAKGIVPGTFAELRAMNSQQQEEQKAQVQAAQEREEQDKAFRRTFSEIFPEYMDERKGNVYNPRTHKDEQTKGQKWLVPFFGNLSMSEITPADVVAFVRECQAPTRKIREHGKKEKALPKPRSPQTIKHYLNLLGQVWAWAKEKGYCQGDNPARAGQVRKSAPQGDSKRSRFLTRDEAAQLLPALKARSVQLWAKCTIMLFSGLRPVEVHALTWEDIDLNNKQIRVRREIKTNKGTTRIVPYSDAVAAMLEEIRPTAPRPADLVFPPKSIRKPGEAGETRRSYEISDAFEDVINGFGWNEGKRQNDKVVPYTLRHTCASWMVQAGVPLYTVSAILGHSTTEITNRYAHLAPDNLRAAIDIFNK